MVRYFPSLIGGDIWLVIFTTVGPLDIRTSLWTLTLGQLFNRHHFIHLPAPIKCTSGSLTTTKIHTAKLNYVLTFAAFFSFLCNSQDVTRRHGNIPQFKSVLFRSFPVQINTGDKVTFLWSLAH